MGWSSTDDFVSEVTVNGKFWRADYLVNLHSISATLTAGRWHDTTGWAGNPVQLMHGNMVTNGDFMATASPWSVGGTWTYTPGTHLMSHGTGNDGSVLSQTVKCVVGEKYTLVWTKGAGGGAITPSLGGTNGTPRTSASTLYREDIIMGSTNALLSFTTTDGTASVVDLVWLFKSSDFTPYTSESEHALYIGPTPGVGETKHLVNMSAFNNALVCSPAILMVVDMVGVYPCVKTSLASKQNLAHSTRLRNGLFVGNATGWTCGANWTYTSNNVVRATAANVEALSQGPLDILLGVPYRLKFTMSSSSGVGTITPALGAVNGTPVTADGTYTQTITPTTSSVSLTFTPTNNNIATTITDVSLVPLFPRYTDGSGLRFFASTSFDTLPGTGGQNMQCEYRNTTGWPTYTVVDSCDSATNWTSNDSANMTTSNNTTTFKSGIGAMNLTKDSVTTALCSTYKTTTSVDFTGKKLGFWFYCVSTTAYAKLAAANSLRVRFGSDSSNYFAWDFVNTALATGLLGQTINGVGWQYIECSQLNYTSKTGTPVLTTCAYTYIGLTASDGTTITWSAGDFIIDQFEVVAESSQLGATVSNTASSIASHILHSGAASGNIGPFLPMASGDSGVQRIENVTFSGVSQFAGSVCIVVCKPLATIPLPYGFVAAERDFMNQLPSLPQIKDGACLGFLLYAGAATTVGLQYAGHIDLGWG